MQLRFIDPQDGLVWVEIAFTPPDRLRSGTTPLGLFIHGKASSMAWLNGRPVGSNGVPGPSADAEIAGLIDSVMFLPRDSLVPGENRLVLAMSAMQPGVRLAYPVNGMGIGPYPSPADRLLALLPALVTFGLFIAGLVYFAVGAWRDYDRRGSALLALASFAAAAQLASEAFRGAMSYPYPWHEVRLLLILGFAVLLGIALLAYTLLRLFPDRGVLRWSAIGVAVIGVGAAIWGAPGFDGKTLYALIAFAVVASASGIVAGVIGRRTGWVVAGLAAALVALMLWTGAAFLDLYLYLCVAALMLWLFVQQGQAVARERAQRLDETARAHDLARALERAERQRERGQGNPAIELTIGNRTEFVPPDKILHFAGAGDYVEAHCADGRSGLLGTTLAALEVTLPLGFIRTHRSHIANGAHVTGLERDAAGGGRLMLAGDVAIPVSRRIMPQVRKSLG